MHDRDKSSSWNAGIAGGFTVDGGFKKGDTLLGQNIIDNSGGKAPYIPDSVEFQYASHDKQGIFRPTITDGTIIIHNGYSWPVPER